MVKFINLVLLLSLVTACSMFPNLGKKEVTYGNIEDRLSVLKGESLINIDYSLEKQSILIPEQTHNDTWYSSSDYNSQIPQNIKISDNFNIRAIEKIGKATDNGDHMSATPIIANGKIYAADSEGLITALDASNIRSKIWKYQIDFESDEGNFANVGLLYSQGRIFISTGYNRIIALNAENGQVIWKRTINSIARSAPAHKDNILFVNTIDNKLYALDSTDGAILWKHSGISEEISIYGSTSPVVYDNIVFASYSSGELYALNLTNGSIIWYDNIIEDEDGRSHSFSDINVTPIIVDRTIYIISSKGAISAYDVYSGAINWKSEVMADKLPWYAKGYFYLINKTNQLIAININNGGVKWIKQLPYLQNKNKKDSAFSWNGPVLAGDKLFITGAHGKLNSYSPFSGELYSTTDIISEVYQPAIIAHETAFLLSDNGRLIAYKSDDSVRSKSLTTKATDLLEQNNTTDSDKKSFWPF